MATPTYIPTYSAQGFPFSIAYPVFFIFQVELVVKNPPANAGDIRDVGSIPESGRFPGEGNSNPLHYSCLENPMDRGAWHASPWCPRELDMTEYTNIRITKIKILKILNAVEDAEQLELSYMPVVMKKYQPLWKTVWQFLIKLIA